VIVLQTTPRRDTLLSPPLRGGALGERAGGSWSATGEIRVPALVTSGRYDEATPANAETVHRGINGSEWVLFEYSSHLAHVEEEDRYMEVVRGFLRRVEGKGR
jgi:pimeloyl-ACP methyl ester carboxylesterase